MKEGLKKFLKDATLAGGATLISMGTNAQEKPKTATAEEVFSQDNKKVEATADIDQSNPSDKSENASFFQEKNLINQEGFKEIDEKLETKRLIDIKRKEIFDNARLKPFESSFFFDNNLSFLSREEIDNLFNLAKEYDKDIIYGMTDEEFEKYVKKIGNEIQEEINKLHKKADLLAKKHRNE